MASSLASTRASCSASEAPIPEMGWTAGLATALECAPEFVRGRMNARTMAREQELPVLEAETVLHELRAVVLDVEPDIAEGLDPDEFDAAVEDRAGE